MITPCKTKSSHFCPKSLSPCDQLEELYKLKEHDQFVGLLYDKRQHHYSLLVKDGDDYYVDDPLNEFLMPTYYHEIVDQLTTDYTYFFWIQNQNPGYWFGFYLEERIYGGTKRLKRKRSDLKDKGEIVVHKRG